MTRYRWVDSRKAEGFPVTDACAAAGVSTSAFYAWAATGRDGPTEGELAEAYLVNAIIEVHRGSGGTYGVPRMTAELRDAGWPVNPKRVARLMRANGVVGHHLRRRVRTTIPAETTPPVPDLIGRGFDPGAPDAAWCGDITYLRTGEGWLYLASVLDLGSRRLLGYSMASHMRTELVTDALEMAVAARGGPDHLSTAVIFHSDRGAQYLSAAYQHKLGQLGMRASAGRTGICWDNSVAEAFWSSLKRELIHRRPFATRADARRAIFTWINWYNRTRRHSSLSYLSPQNWEQRYRHPQPRSGPLAA